MLNAIDRWTCRVWEANRVTICLGATWLLASLGALGAIVPPAIAPAVTFTTNYYDVRGESAEALLNSMRARPTTHDAVTQWTVTWSFRMQSDAAGSVLRTFSTQVRIRYVLPRWVDLPRAPEPLRREWTRYMGALMVHEKGHSEFGIAAAREMVRVVCGREWRASTAEGVKASLDQACEGIMQDFRAREVTYDQKTDHGRSQGALFRPTMDGGRPESPAVRGRG